MAFGSGLVGGALVQSNVIANIQGESSPGYEPGTGRIQFQRASGSIYTPARVDTLILILKDDEGPPALDVLIPSSDALVANADTGCLVTDAIIPADCNGLPWNFGPGVGQWARVTGRGPRLRLTFQTLPDSLLAPTGQGSLQYEAEPSIGGADLSTLVRNYFGVQITKLAIIIECLHSVQG